MRRKLGLFSVAAGYLLTVVGANWAISHLGTAPPFPGAPHTIPVGLGYTAPSGVLFVALALVLRDLVQYLTGVRGLRKLALMTGLIAGGAGLSYVVADPKVATASALAFGLSELVDFALFTWVAPRWARAVVAGGVAGGIADSLIFLSVAFGSLAFWQGQIIGKTEGVVLAAVLITLRRRRTAVTVVSQIAAADCKVSVSASVRKLCPVRHEVDAGSVTIRYRTRGKALELHSLANYLDTFDDRLISHEDFNAEVAKALRADVSSQWDTAGMYVEVSQ